jgi:hypothetical protein
MKSNLMKRAARYSSILAVFGVGVFSIIGSATAPPSQRTHREPQYTSYPVDHLYEIKVVDIDGRPVQNAQIEYKAVDVVQSRDVPKSSGVVLLTNETRVDTKNAKPSLSAGKLTIEPTEDTPKIFKIKVTANPDTTYSPSWIDYKTKLSYEISAPGYYSISGELDNDTGSRYTSSYHSSSKSNSNNPVTMTATLYKPIDYFAPEFILSDKDSNLKKKIYTFIDNIRVKGYLSNAFLKHRSINSENFKRKKYIAFKFEDGIVYNSLKLNKYDIAKNIFDEIVRKIMNPLNDFISDPAKFYGYDIIVIGNTKDFSEKYARSTPIEYKFYIPEAAVKSYKAKDISGQQLIDKSVILMNDERIDLKLQ